MLSILQSMPEFDPQIAAEFGNGMSASTFLGVPVFEAASFSNLLIRFAFNLIVAFVTVHYLYYRHKGRKDYYFTFLLFSATMFLLIFLMENVKLQIGFTLGLFAIFGMIRYRTETVPVREMTYKRACAEHIHCRADDGQCAAARTDMGYRGMCTTQTQGNEDHLV